LRVVDRGEGLLGQCWADAALVVAEPDERPQQLGHGGQVAGVVDDLARDPVEQQDLHRSGAPPHRVPQAVVGAEPEQRFEQAAGLATGVIRPGR
jgi:hypothetical protein